MNFRHHLPNRREALLGAGSLFAWSQMPRLARAEGRDPRLLVIVLRGALDGVVANYAYSTTAGAASYDRLGEVGEADGFGDAADPGGVDQQWRYGHCGGIGNYKYTG